MKSSVMAALVRCAVVLLCICGSVMCEQNESTNPLESLFSYEAEWSSVGRTMGHHALKRLAFIFLPVMFTLGVISTLLLAITAISVKNLAIGVILLIVGISQAISRVLFAAPAPVAAAAPLVHYSHFPRAEPSFASPWSAAAGAPLLSPWARSDDAGSNIQE